MKIYSKIKPKTLLHLVYRLEDFNSREDIAPVEEFLQLASLRLDSGKTFLPHKHIEKPINYTSTIAQESWVVIKGSVDVHFYDLDDSFLRTETLKAGDCSMTFRGGHTYSILEDNTFVYEFKTGPYEGQALDKKHIDPKH